MSSPTDIQEEMLVEEDEDEDEQPGFHTPPTGPDREEMVAEYIPDSDDWPAKSKLAINDPARVAAIEQWSEMFPECSHHQQMYDEYLETFLKGRTSINGDSRDEIKSILRSMFGASDESSRGGLLISGVGGDLGDD